MIPPIARNTPATVLVPNINPIPGHHDNIMDRRLHPAPLNINIPAVQPPPNIKPLPGNHDNINPLPGHHDNIDQLHNNNNIALVPPPNLNSISGNNPGSDNDRHGDPDPGDREEEDMFDLEIPAPDQGDSQELLQQLQDDKVSTCIAKHNTCH